MLSDESLSMLDVKNQELVLNLLNKIKHEHTIVIISREDSIVRKADNVIVMNDNTVAEFGNYNSIIKAKGLYYNSIYNK